jgi:hypothetical protein
MDIPAELMAAFPPSADLLLDSLRRAIDDAMLTEIARADYGHMADEMLAELRPIRDSGIIPAPMQGQLAEVLALTRWCNPEVPDPPPFEPGPTGRRGHQTRLFACAVLMRGALNPENEDCDGSEDSTLAQSLTSAKVLGAEMSEAVARFLTWRLPRMKYCSDPPLFALGLLILATRLGPERFPEPALAKVAEWVVAEESLHRQAIPAGNTEPIRLAFSIQSGFWQPLATELSEKAEAVREEGVRHSIQLCNLLLEPG